jgi:hypothetical protein
MDKILQYTDATGTLITVGCVGDLRVKDIDPIDTWTITTEDLNGVTDSVEWVGARPKK